MTRDACLLATGAIFSFMLTVCTMAWLIVIPQNKWINRLEERVDRTLVAKSNCEALLGTTGGAGSWGVPYPHKLDAQGREYIEEYYK